MARALLGQPAILIVDEIDASLDSQAVKVFEDVVRHFNGTVLMVSRFKERLMLADCFWQLDAGQVKVVPKSDAQLAIEASFQNR